MSNRQNRIARKARQRAGEEVYLHVKPTRRVLAPLPMIPGDPTGASKVERDNHLSGQKATRRLRRYKRHTTGQRDRSDER